MTPFQALYGRLPPAIPNYQVFFCSESRPQSRGCDELLRQLKCNLETSINRMKQLADKKTSGYFFRSWGFGVSSAAPLHATDRLQLEAS